MVSISSLFQVSVDHTQWGKLADFYVTCESRMVFTFSMVEKNEKKNDLWHMKITQNLKFSIHKLILWSIATVIYLRMVAFELPWQSWVVATDINGPQTLKYLLSGPLTEKAGWPFVLSHCYYYYGFAMCSHI